MTLVLVVDDDQDLAEMLGIVLTGAGIDVDLVSRGDEALEAFRNNPPDLVLLDVMLPGLDGIEVCKQIRAESMVPIVMLSAKGDTHDVVRGLEAGADDYMVKPFRHQTELVARIRTRLRRTNTDVAGLLTISDLIIDVNAHEVTRAGNYAYAPRIRSLGRTSPRTGQGI
jgi:two-component system response regulator MtrA